MPLWLNPARRVYACAYVCKLCQHCSTCLKPWVQRWSFAAVKGLTGSTERKKAFFWLMDSVFQFLIRREKQERGLVFLPPSHHILPERFHLLTVLLPSNKYQKLRNKYSKFETMGDILDINFKTGCREEKILGSTVSISQANKKISCRIPLW